MGCAADAARSYPIPLVLGGTGRRMMDLVREYADWWNLPANHLDKLGELAPSAGTARASVQQMVGFVRSGADPNKVREVSTRRFGNLGSGLVCGDAAELIDHFARLAGQGVERCYVWFADFAVPESLHEFGESVIRCVPSRRRRASVGTTGGRAKGPRWTALSRISGRSTDGSTVSSQATASATSDTWIANISKGTSWSISVSTGPGVTMCTLMPSRSTSSARARANAFMPAFDAEYAVRAGIGSCAADDEMNTSREPARMRGSTAEVTTKHESRFAEMIACHCRTSACAHRSHPACRRHGRRGRSSPKRPPRRRIRPDRGVGHEVSRTDLLGGCPQWAFAPRHQHHVVPQLAKLAAASFADTAAAAGDQCGPGRSQERRKSLGRDIACGESAWIR